MSSSEFSKVLVRDERLDCHPTIPFAVYKSGQNVTVSTFNAISANASSHTYNIQVPSETTIIDRRVIWECAVKFRVSFTAAAGAGAESLANLIGNNAPLVSFGSNCAFGPWPLHSLCTTQQITINNNSVSINMNDVLPALVKMGDDRTLSRYNDMAQTLGDNFADYRDVGLSTNSNVLGSYLDVGQDTCFRPRGGAGGVLIDNYTLNGAAMNVGITYGCWSGGNNLVPPNGGGGAIVNGAIVAGTVIAFDITAQLKEPLMISPFIYCHPDYNGQGFYGIQNLNFVFNLNLSNSAGLLRTAFGGAYTNVTVAAPTNGDAFTPATSQLVFNFLSPKPSDMLTARNVVPYWEMPRYITTVTGPGAATAPVSGGSGTITPVVQSVSSSSIQLNQIPDKLIIFVRRPKATRQTSFTDSCCVIKGISVNFNNQSGILASATKEELFRFSLESGSNQTFDEYCGVCSTPAGPLFAGHIEKPLLGSYLMLEMGRHIQITEDYYAPGSLGNFNLQFTLQLENYSTFSYTAADLVLITLNTGIFVNEKGQSATYTGVLTKDDVLTASSSDSVNQSEVKRLIGGGIMSGLMSGLKKAAGVLSPIRQISDSLLPQDGVLGKLRKGIGMADDLKTAAGMGKSGGRMYGSGKGSAKFLLADRLV